MWIIPGFIILFLIIWMMMSEHLFEHHWKPIWLTIVKMYRYGSAGFCDRRIRINKLNPVLNKIIIQKHIVINVQNILRTTFAQCPIPRIRKPLTHFGNPPKTKISCVNVPGQKLIRTIRRRIIHYQNLNILITISLFR